jgi:hypothetical protein
MCNWCEDPVVKFLNRITEDTINAIVEIVTALDDSVAEALRLKGRAEAVGLTSTVDQLDIFISSLQQIWPLITKDLIRLLPMVRTGTKDVSEIQDLLYEFSNSPVNQQVLTKWLHNVDREITYLQEVVADLQEDNHMGTESPHHRIEVANYLSQLQLADSGINAVMLLVIFSGRDSTNEHLSIISKFTNQLQPNKGFKSSGSSGWPTTIDGIRWFVLLVPRSGVTSSG